MRADNVVELKLIVVDKINGSVLWGHPLTVIITIIYQTEIYAALPQIFQIHIFFSYAKLFVIRVERHLR